MKTCHGMTPSSWTQRSSSCVRWNLSGLSPRNLPFLFGTRSLNPTRSCSLVTIYYRLSILRPPFFVAPTRKKSLNERFPISRELFYFNFGSRSDTSPRFYFDLIAPTLFRKIITTVPFLTGLFTIPYLN